MSLMVGPALSQFHESRVHINDKGLVTRSVWQIVTVEKEKEKEKVEERKLELAAPSPEPELPPVYIEVICEYKTEFGQLLRLFWWCDEEKNAAGNLLSSGTKGVVPMVWSEGNIWRVTLQQPKRSFIHFKLEVAVEKVNAVVRREFLGERPSQKASSL